MLARLPVVLRCTQARMTSMASLNHTMFYRGHVVNGEFESRADSVVTAAMRHSRHSCCSCHNRERFWDCCRGCCRADGVFGQEASATTFILARLLVVPRYSHARMSSRARSIPTIARTWPSVNWEAAPRFEISSVIRTLMYLERGDDAMQGESLGGVVGSVRVHTTPPG